MSDLNIGLIGMPFYTARLEKELKDYDPMLKVKAFNTYTSRLGKLTFALKAPFLDAVFSVNGDNRKSKAFSWAKRNGVRLIMNWSGTDVITCTENFKRGDVDQELVDYAEHTCQCSWIQDELKLIGIKAKIIQFQAYQVSAKPAVPKQLKVLCRISQDRPEFYGMRELITLAELHPEVQFTAVGMQSYSQHVPANIDLKGWVSDMDVLFNDHLVALRFPVHDGLSPFVMESLSNSLHVLYRFPFKYTLHTPNLDSLKQQFEKLKNQYQSGNLTWNEAGRDLIKEEFSEKRVFSAFVEYLQGAD